MATQYRPPAAMRRKMLTVKKTFIRQDRIKGDPAMPFAQYEPVAVRVMRIACVDPKKRIIKDREDIHHRKTGRQVAATAVVDGLEDLLPQLSRF
jgi:hypothetical protein